MFEIVCGGNTSALNVIILTEHINATYYINFDIPLRNLHKRKSINFAVASQKHVAASKRWQEPAEEFKPDVIILTRYSEEGGREILANFKRKGIPLIYHIDDDLLAVPESLGNEILMQHGSEEVVNTRHYLLQNCDLIYASTQVLAGLMKQRFPSQHVVHGICALYMGKELTLSVPRSGNDQVIGYMGSKGHQKDLELVVPALERLLEERRELKFEVFGTIKIPDALERFGPRVRRYSVQTNYADFIATLANMNWSIGLAPLDNVPFNQCKTPTKFVEYTACGIAVIASRISVYEEAIPKNGGWLVDSDWYATIKHVLDHPIERQKAVLTAQNYCAVKYDAEILEQQILDITQNVIIRKRKIMPVGIG